MVLLIYKGMLFSLVYFIITYFKSLKITLAILHIYSSMKNAVAVYWESIVSEDKFGRNFHHYNIESLNSQVILHLLKPYSTAFSIYLYPSL